MEFTAHTTVNVLREMSTLNRKWYSRPLSFLGSLRAILYLVVFLVLGVSLVYQGLQASPIDMHLVGKGLLVLLILFAVLGFLYYNNVRKTANRLAHHPPIRYTLTAEGVALTDPGESVVFTPWKAFSSFRFGKHIATLNRADQRGFQTIPISALSAVESGQLRGVLLSYLPKERNGNHLLFFSGISQELRKAGRRWPYRPVQFVGNFRVAAFILGAFAFALRSFYLGFRTSPMDQDSILNGIIIVSIIAVFIAILKYRERARAKRDAA